jgi:hypothetical protein
MPRFYPRVQKNGRSSTIPWSEGDLNKRAGRNLRLLAITFLIGFTALSSLHGNANAHEKRPTQVRPGKELSIVNGDYAEYSNTLYDGKDKTIMPLKIMIAVGMDGELNAVQALSVEGEKLKSTSTIYYDRSRAKVEEGYRQVRLVEFVPSFLSNIDPLLFGTKSHSLGHPTLADVEQ